MKQGERLTKVRVELPNHWATGGESMWAVELGDDLYELRNVPFHAYDLNFADVVRATADAPDLKPEIREVVRRSGHQTLRLFFQDTVAPDRRLELLHSLARFDVTFERATKKYFALDLAPGASLERVRVELDIWEVQELVEYETCEARIPGSFDDSPDG